MRPARPSRAAAALALAALLAGCAARRPPTPPDPQPVAAPATRPAPRAGVTGLELWIWQVADERTPIEIPPREPPPPEPPADPERGSGSAPKPDDPPDQAAAGEPERPRTPAGPDSSTFAPRRPNAPPPDEPPPPDLPPTFNDGRLDLETLLAPHRDRPVPLAGQAAERWRAAGLDVLAVPIGDLGTIELQARLTGVVQRQWLGTVALWSEIAAGPPLAEPTPLTTADGPTLLPRGRPRLLARAWPEPLPPEADAPARVALRVELMPQVAAPAGARRPEDSFEPADPTPLGAERQGAPIPGLGASAALAGDVALVIVPTEAEPGAARSLGAWTLTAPAGPGPATRRVLVLVPRVGGAPRLLP